MINDFNDKWGWFCNGWQNTKQIFRFLKKFVETFDVQCLAVFFERDFFYELVIVNFRKMTREKIKDFLRIQLRFSGMQNCDEIVYFW